MDRPRALLAFLFLFVTATCVLSQSQLSGENKSKAFSLSDHIEIPTAKLKPTFNGKYLNKNQMNLTSLAHRIQMQPDYYDAGEGPEDDEDYEVIGTRDEKVLAEVPTVAIETASEPTILPNRQTELKNQVGSTSPTIIPLKALDGNKVSDKIFSISDHITIPEFKSEPRFKGKYINKNQMNLTELAKRIQLKPDYYAPGEGPEEDEEEIALLESSSTTSTPSPMSESFESDENKKNTAKAVGGVTGIIERLLRGPSKSELNANSSAEEVYVYIQSVINQESRRALKAILPRLYDYQFSIGNRVSQRCFNSLTQTANGLRQGTKWASQSKCIGGVLCLHANSIVPVLSSSARVSRGNLALRQYGNFDKCLDLVSTGGAGQFTGQYCMMSVHFPLPALNSTWSTYGDIALQLANHSDASGTVSYSKLVDHCRDCINISFIFNSSQNSCP